MNVFNNLRFVFLSILFFQVFFGKNELYANLEFDKNIIEQTALLDSKSLDVEFKFKNNSKNKIAITEISTTCTCTLAKLNKNCYTENEEGVIKGIFHISDRQGIQDQKIIIKTDNANQPQIILSIRVIVPKFATITPSLLFWHTGDRPDSKNVSINLAKDLGVTLKSITCDSNNFILTYKEKEEGEYNLFVTPSKVEDQSRATIKVLIEDKNNKEKVYNLHVLIK